MNCALIQNYLSHVDIPESTNTVAGSDRHAKVRRNHGFQGFWNSVGDFCKWSRAAKDEIEAWTPLPAGTPP